MLWRLASDDSSKLVNEAFAHLNVEGFVGQKSVLLSSTGRVTRNSKSAQSSFCSLGKKKWWPNPCEPLGGIATAFFSCRGSLKNSVMSALICCSNPASTPWFTSCKNCTFLKITCCCCSLIDVESPHYCKVKTVGAFFFT